MPVLHAVMQPVRVERSNGHLSVCVRRSSAVEAPSPLGMKHCLGLAPGNSLHQITPRAHSFRSIVEPKYRIAYGQVTAYCESLTKASSSFHLSDWRTCYLMSRDGLLAGSTTTLPSTSRHAQLVERAEPMARLGVQAGRDPCPAS